jgi:membrane-associated protease RseP (regulator of RpoE activity)
MDKFHIDVPELPEGVTSGVIIGTVADGSPAQAAGLKVGDLITAVDGESIQSQNAVAESVAAHKPGDTLQLKIYRPDEKTEIDVEARLAERSDKAGSAYLGVTINGFITTNEFNGGQMPYNFFKPDGNFNFRFPPLFRERPFLIEPPGSNVPAEPGDSA